MAKPTHSNADGSPSGGCKAAEAGPKPGNIEQANEEEMKMKNTANILGEIQDILNTDYEVQKLMQVMAEQAKQSGLTPEQWHEAKSRLVQSLFYKMALVIPEIQQGIAEDVYQMHHQ